MNVLGLDVENDVTWTDDDVCDISPFHPGNQLVSVGSRFLGEEGQYRFFNHSQRIGTYTGRPWLDDHHNFERLQADLDRADLLVMHNGKHDLMWLQATGFKVTCPIYDTKIGAYILLRGRKWSTTLGDLCIRHNLPHKKSELVDQYMKDKVKFSDIPMDVVEEYGRGDVDSTLALYSWQIAEYETDRNRVLKPTRRMMNEMLEALAMIETNGIQIDRAALDEIEEDYKTELKELTQWLSRSVSALMGATPINLASKDDMSRVIFSRQPKDKKEWKALFNLGKDAAGRQKQPPKLTAKQFVALVRDNTVLVQKSKAVTCLTCNGSGQQSKVTKKGVPYKRQPKCTQCLGGVRYVGSGEYAGLKLSAKDAWETAVSGFSVGKEVLERLLIVARTNNNELQIDFLTKLMRFNKVTVYLNSFVGGIKKRMLKSGVLHAKFNQTVAATGRLSSSQPNFQNQPRGGTFPVRRAVVSRFPGGKIMEFDYSQLEFRAAGALSGCPNVLHDVRAGIDAHQFTADTMCKAGQPTTRQDAKPHTFKPLYGGTQGTPAEVAYFADFLNVRYPRVKAWHEELCSEAITYKCITSPSGRQYAFDAQRTAWGGTTNATKIKNYEVQGFATGDIVPISAINIKRKIDKKVLEMGMHSLYILTVHDSHVMDVYPGEERICAEIMLWAMLPKMVTEMKRRYGYETEMPWAIEGKMGDNWLETKVILVADTLGNEEWTL